MSLNNTEKSNLCVVAREHWISSQIALTAYLRNFERNRQTSAWLRRATLTTALAAAISASANGVAAFYHVEAADPLKWVAVASSLLTAAIAAIDQNYAPKKNSQTFWECKAKLEEIKREISSWSIEIDSFSDIKAGRIPLDQISKRMEDATKEPVDHDPKDRNSAEIEFERTALRQIMSRYEGGASATSSKAPEALSFDAPGIIAVDSPLSAGAKP